jgi:hypothetical protein
MKTFRHKFDLRQAFAALLLIGSLVGCAGNSRSTPTAAATPAGSSSSPTKPAETAVATPSSTPSGGPAAEPTAAEPTAVGPTPVSSIPEPADIDPSIYIDDRSDGVSVIKSLFNAINRKEYARAYSYWATNSNATQPGPFDQFKQGYADTASVQLATGTIGYSVGAGQTYLTVPVVLASETTTGQMQTFYGCYVLHLGSPTAQASPPFMPLSIISGALQQGANDSDSQALLAQGCQAENGQTGTVPAPPRPTTAPGDISIDRYLDDRSNGLQVVRSLFNAINRHEYLRAYSYWQNAESSPSMADFNKFQEGYADTASVALQVGQVSTDAGAGQIHYGVPVVLTAQTTQGQMQTFSGCYLLHIANPGLQTEPPFIPLSVDSANVQQVANDADGQTLLAQNCQGNS